MIPDQRDNTFEQREAAVSRHVFSAFLFYWKAEKKENIYRWLLEFGHMKGDDVVFGQREAAVSRHRECRKYFEPKFP